MKDYEKHYKLWCKIICKERSTKTYDFMAWYVMTYQHSTTSMGRHVKHMSPSSTGLMSQHEEPTAQSSANKKKMKKKHLEVIL